MEAELTFFPVLKRRTEYEKKPVTGDFYSYSHYRAAIAEDCKFRCVYCDSHEDVVGGEEAMELDHFRPWNKGFGKNNDKKFGHLKHTPENLVHACKVCNRFKWAHWPTENPDLCYDHEKGWLDPFVEDRSEFFSIELDGAISAKKPPALYQITTLRLNRPLLKRQREFRSLLNNITTFEIELRVVIKEEGDTNHAKTAAKTLLLIESIRRLMIPTK